MEHEQTRTYKVPSDGNSKNISKQETKPNQIIDNNATMLFTMDSRTPPKIKLHHKFFEKKKLEPVENSHPGIAVPIDVDSFLETTTPRRAVIYRTEGKTATTNSGLSTWILLSGQSTTSKPSRKPATVKSTTLSTSTSTTQGVTSKSSEKPFKPTIKVIKPLTTRKPKTTTTIPTPTTITTTSPSPVTIVSSTQTSPTTTTVTSVAPKTTLIATSASKPTTEKIQNNRIITKIKASVLNNAVNNKTTPVTIAPPTTISVVTQTTVSTKKTTVALMEPVNITKSKNTEVNDLNQPEAKDGAIELSNEKHSTSGTTTKRPKRPANNNKRKKNNKNRRRKPGANASEKIDTAVNGTKLAIKEKPIGTQIYNYLSREVMPTVGVGLVGLVVTAGLASYFLYPFGALRRTYTGATDRKDYYYDEYATGGLPEEEIIGKVIAGMPENTNYPTNYRTPLARKDYKNEVNYNSNNYRNSDPYYQYPYNEYQTVSVGSKIGYSRDVVAEHQKETGYTVDDGEMDKKFVVGNIPKEFDQPITPVAVPEHGPRSLRIRRKRFAQHEKENEILDFNYPTKDNIKPYLRQKPSTSTTDITVSESTSQPPLTTTIQYSTTEDIILQPEQPSVFTFLRNLLELKVRIGLDFLLKTTDSVNRYLRGVQERVNTVLKKESRH